MIKHAFSCPIADGGSPNTIQPSDWNAPHVLEVVDVDPLAPSPGDLWMLGTGSTPNRLLEFKFCDLDGVIVTLFSVLR